MEKPLNYGPIESFPACSELTFAGRRLVEKERDAFARSLLEYCRHGHGILGGASRYAALTALPGLFMHSAHKFRNLHFLMKVDL